MIPFRGPSQPEKAQITVDVADQLYRNLRTKNELTHEQGDDLSSMSFSCGQQRKAESRTRTSCGIAEMDSLPSEFQDEKEERLCNAFAEEFLLPTDVLRQRGFRLIFGRATSWVLQTSSESRCMPRR